MLPPSAPFRMIVSQKPWLIFQLKSSNQRDNTVRSRHFIVYQELSRMFSPVSFKPDLRHVQGRHYYLRVPEEGTGSESKIKCFIQDHTPNKRQSGDSNPGFPILSSATVP